ncbi:hypothetical protein MferCBS49748_000564 [Microsporum ferrugineum]
MAYFQGLAMGGFEMAMGMAAAGPPPPNPPGSGYSNVPMSRPAIIQGETDEENAEDKENQDIAAFVPVSTTPFTSAALTTSITIALPAIAASTATPAIPALLNSGERRPPRQPCRAGADDPENYTDIIPSQSSWSFDNLPDILYVFRGPDRPRGNPNIPYKPSPWKNSPPLRCFSILPDRISSNVEEFRVEAWMRMDRRIQLRDITNRMNPKFRIFANTLQQRGVRFRQAFSIASWGVSSKQTDIAIEIIRAKLIKANVDLSKNTTRGVTPGLKFLDQGETGGRVPTPKQYAKRPDTTIRRGMAAANIAPRSIGPALAPVFRMQAPTPAITTETNATATRTPVIPSIATASAYPATPAISTLAGGLPTPIPSPTPTLSAQVLIRAATDAIANPQAHCYMAPVVSESGEIGRARAPDMDAANDMLESAIENILQRHTRNPDFENALRQTSIMQEYRSHFTPRPPQTLAEAGAYFRRADAIRRQTNGIRNHVADTEPAFTPMPQPLPALNSEHYLLRRVQRMPIGGSAAPRIEKSASRRNCQIHSSPTRKPNQRQNFREAVRNVNVNRISQAISSVHANSIAQPAQPMADIQSYCGNPGVDDIEIIDISDDEVVEHPPTSPIPKLEETDNAQYELDGLDPATVRSIVNSTEARTETEFLQLCDRFTNSTRNNVADEGVRQTEDLTAEFNDLRERALRIAAQELDDAVRVEDDIAEEIDATPSFDELINIYEHEEEDELEHPGAQEIGNAPIEDPYERIAAEMQLIASQQMDQFLGMSPEQQNRFLAGYPGGEWDL